MSAESLDALFTSIFEREAYICENDDEFIYDGLFQIPVQSIEAESLVDFEKPGVHSSVLIYKANKNAETLDRGEVQLYEHNGNDELSAEMGLLRPKSRCGDVLEDCISALGSHSNLDSSAEDLEDIQINTSAEAKMVDDNSQRPNRFPNDLPATAFDSMEHAFWALFREGPSPAPAQINDIYAKLKSKPKKKTFIREFGQWSKKQRQVETKKVQKASKDFIPRLSHVVKSSDAGLDKDLIDEIVAKSGLVFESRKVQRAFVHAELRKIKKKDKW